MWYLSHVATQVVGSAAQDAEQLIEALRAHVEREFARLGSSNSAGVRVKSVGDWWEADPESKLFKMAERALTREWGRQPLFVREGGPCLCAPAYHPCCSHSWLGGVAEQAEQQLRLASCKGIEVLSVLPLLLYMTTSLALDIVVHTAGSSKVEEYIVHGEVQQCVN